MLDPRTVTVPADLPEFAESGEVAVKQFNFRELTVRRFKRHPTAKWALLVLGIIFAACYGSPIWHLLLPGWFQGLGDFTLADREQAPSLKHLFGTDQFVGLAIFSHVLCGGRLSLYIGLGSMVIATAIGVSLGAIAGYFGRWLDAVLMRVTDVFLTVPVLLTIPLASKVFGHADPTTLMVIFGLLSWQSIARIVRSTFLSLREMQFAEAARALGVGPLRTIFRQLLPTSVGPIVVAFTLGVANNIVLEAFVIFLGFGIQPPNYSWGSTLAGGQGVLVQGNWWWITFPGLAVVATVLCINFIGDGLRDALDPKIIR